MEVVVVVGLQEEVVAHACLEEEDPYQVGQVEVSWDHVAQEEEEASWASLEVLLGVEEAYQEVLEEVACLEVGDLEAS